MGRFNKKRGSNDVPMKSEYQRRIEFGLCPKCGKGKARDDKYCFRCNLHAGRADAKIKEAAFLHYGGWECTCCGNSMREALQIDHVNNDGAEHRKGTGCGTGIKFYRWLKASGYPPGFTVLCASCNTAKQLNGGICPHEVERQKHVTEHRLESRPG